MSEKEIASTLAENSEASDIEQLSITAKICAKNTSLLFALFGHLFHYLLCFLRCVL